MKRYKITLTEDELEGIRQALLNNVKFIQEATDRIATPLDGDAMNRLTNILNNVNIQKDDPRNELD